MSFLHTVKNWSPKKKKTFSLFLAGCITLTIVGLGIWYNYFESRDGTYRPDPLSPLSGLFVDIMAGFHSASAQFSSTTTFIKAQLASSSFSSASGMATGTQK